MQIVNREISAAMEINFKPVHCKVNGRNLDHALRVPFIPEQVASSLTLEELAEREVQEARGIRLTRDAYLYIYH